MLLTNNEIIDAHHSYEIVIDPFDHRNVNSASYDVRLGPHYFVQGPPPPGSMRYGGCPVYDLHNSEVVNAVWQHKIATPVATSGPANGSEPSQQYVIWIKPKQIILAHTLEFIGSPGAQANITTQMHSRSSSVRNCIDVCGSGGWGDHGFCNRWTMEIVNTSPEYAIPLVVGTRIAQISFFRTKTAHQDYATHGKYQNTSNLEEMKVNWRPEMMLPKSYNDWESEKGVPDKDLIQRLIDKHE